MPAKRKDLRGRSWREVCDATAKAGLEANGTLERTRPASRYEFGEYARRQSVARRKVDDLEIELAATRACRDPWE